MKYAKKNKIVDWLKGVGNQSSYLHWKQTYTRTRIPFYLQFPVHNIYCLWKFWWIFFFCWTKKKKRCWSCLVWFDFALLSAYTCIESWANTLENYLLHGAINRTTLTHVSMIVLCIVTHYGNKKKFVFLPVGSLFVDFHSRFVHLFQVFNNSVKFWARWCSRTRKLTCSYVMAILLLTR